jgi:hypothetical protein
MATRADIIEAFYGELKSAASGDHTVERSDGSTYTITVDANQITQTNPETETLPQVVYNDSYRRVGYNGVGAGPDYVERSGGTVDNEVWREYVQAQFLVDVRASNSLEKEPIYEAVHGAFGKYAFGAWPKSDLHADIISVEVIDSRSTDVGDEEDVIRGDQVEVRITFYRDYKFSTDNLTQVNHDIEGATYTTT